MELDPKDFMIAIPAPPVVLVSTLYGHVKNIAPYGMNMPISFSPPLFAVGVGAARDTYKNITDTGQFVVCIPSPEMTGAINCSAREYPRDVSEFEKAGLTPEPSRVVDPFRVSECQAHLECELAWSKEAGDHYIMVGRVVAASVVESLGVGGMRRDKLDPVYHDSVLKSLYARKGPHIP
jgi:flavin reductase (DIM6/NTAB) family NADH-FMN oxidoreductase RutF